MDALTICILLTILLVIVLACMGLSYIDMGLDGLGYATRNKEHVYYSNPLLPINSIYFHYKPKDAVIVSKRTWVKIETNMAYALRKAEEQARSEGFSDALAQIEHKAKEKLSSYVPDSYKLLGVTKAAKISELLRARNALLERFKPENFEVYGAEFVRLASIKTEQINTAYDKITNSHYGSKIEVA
jgi:hypothetical protein